MTLLIDTNVLIAFFDPNDAHHERSAPLVKRLLRGEIDTVAPALILTEVTAGIYRRTKDAALARQICEQLSIHPKMTWLDVSVQMALEAAAFAIEANIRGGADAIIAYVAKRRGAMLVTTDDKLREQVNSHLAVFAPEDVTAQ